MHNNEGISELEAALLKISKFEEKNFLIENSLKELKVSFAQALMLKENTI